VLGGRGLGVECAAARLVVTTGPARVDAVLVGSDGSFNYAQLAAATSALRRGVPLVGCNRDVTFPGEGGVLLPGCGAVLAAVEAAAGRLADAVVGKPTPGLLTDLWAPTGTSAADWFVVGDSVDADLGLAAAAGVPGVLLGHPGCGYPDRPVSPLHCCPPEVRGGGCRWREVQHSRCRAGAGSAGRNTKG